MRRLPQALAAHQATRTDRHVDQGIAEAVERQTRAMRELSRRAFPEPEETSADRLAIDAARAQRRREVAATEVAALRRARAERVAQQAGTAAVVAYPALLRTTA
ncbi:hypothetical protein [Streptomyces sp. NPDC053726]|uniref:hypothetical protein n=1 Tax=Streptomyces sp. NPDC053726 TaxID=3365713 RepID=UPI0037D1338F